MVYCVGCFPTPFFVYSIFSHENGMMIHFVCGSFQIERYYVHVRFLSLMLLILILFFEFHLDDPNWI